MTTRPAPDQASRDRIADDLGATLFVEAAAGTGKTTALVDRVVQLVATGAVRLRHVAAITFTEKAAAELRDRLRRALTQAALDRGGEAADRCGAALDDLDDAAVSTLHAFAHRVLAQYPLEAGLPPRFEVLDELQAAAAFDRAWDAFAARLFEHPDDDVRTAVTLGLRPGDLRDLALAFHDHWDRLGDDPPDLPDLPAVDVRPVIDALEAALSRLGACTAPDADSLALHLTGLEATLDRLRDVAGDALGALTALAEAPGFSHRRGQAARWGGNDAIASVRDLLDEAQAAREEILEATGGALATRFADRLRRFVLDEAGRRRRDGRLIFHDLLVLACRLVRRRDDVRGRLRDRWQRLLIDEFQDTDPLQIELAILLATTAPGPIEARWRELEVEPGRLFLVGDPKQSIYRFRRADIALYQAVQAHVSGGVVTLQANFRCATPVVKWVNAVFGQLMGSGSGGLQAPYVPLMATRSFAAPTVQVLGGPWAKNATASEIRQREASEIAGLVRRVGDEGWSVHDSSDGGSGAARPARLADVAVLLPTRRLLPELERALVSGGIPYRIESRSLLWSTQEVRDLLAALRSIDDPSDEVALVAALRSPAFGCRDDELLAWRGAGGSWSYLEDPPSGFEGSESVPSALHTLRLFHESRHWTPLHALVERLLRERHVLAVQVAHRRPRDHWRRLRFVADHARAFEESGGATLRGFVDWAEHQAQEEALVNESVTPERDDDAVSIFTVHAAKGLEFPIVVLAGLGSAPPPRRPPALFDASGSVEVSIGRADLGFHTPGYDDRLAAEREAERAEGLRLLYVGATRARDHLVVSLHHKETATRSPAHVLHGVDAPLVASDPVGMGPASPASAPVPAVSDRAAWARERERLLADAVRAPAVAATGLAGGVVAEPPDAPPWKRGRAGTAIGRAVHAVLQSVDLASGADVEALARAQAGAEGVADRESEIVRAARAALSSSAVRAAVASGRFWREVYVGVEIEGTTLEGFIDLLYERDGDLVVVDYKTDRIDGNADAVLDRYRLQGAAYAAALETALCRPVSECIFVFVGDGHAVERGIEDLPAAVVEARQRLATC